MTESVMCSRAGRQRSFAPHFYLIWGPRDDSLIFILVFGVNKTEYNAQNIK